MSATDSSNARRPKGSQVITFLRPADKATIDVIEDSDVLDIVVGARRWNMHNYPNFLIDLVTIDLHSPTEMRMMVSSPYDLRGLCGMGGYFRTMNNLDAMSRLRLALEVAKEVRYLHETSPLHCYGQLVLGRVLVSAEGKPLFGPPEWTFSRIGREDPTRSNPFNCLMPHALQLPPTNVWPRPEGHRLKPHSPQARRTAEIWDFGCMLFQIITTDWPLRRYKRLAVGQLAIVYEPNIVGDIPDSFWHGPLEVHVYQARYETVVSVLLDEIEVPEEVKAVLRSCWAFEPEDRSSMQVVVERLELGLEAIG